MVAGWSGWARSQALRVCWKRSTLPQVVGWLGREFFWVIAEAAQLGLEAVAAAAAAGQAGGEHHAVVGQGRRRWPVPVDGGAEGVDDDRAGDPEVGGERQGVAGVVVEPGQDLGCRPGGERVVGEVGLPHLVGLLGFEADVGRAGPLPGCGVTSPWRRRCDRSWPGTPHRGGARGARRSCPRRRRALGAQLGGGARRSARRSRRAIAVR